MSKTIIDVDNISYLILKKEDESNEQFYSRAWYVSKSKPKNEKEFKLALVKADIKSNIEYLDNSYSKNITDLL